VTAAPSWGATVDVTGGLAGAFRLAAAVLAKAILLTAAAEARTAGDAASGLAALRAASRLAAGVANKGSDARTRGVIAAVLDIKRKEGRRRTPRKAANKKETKTNRTTQRTASLLQEEKQVLAAQL
jgi:hypothetical protein